MSSFSPATDAALRQFPWLRYAPWNEFMLRRIERMGTDVLGCTSTRNVSTGEQTEYVILDHSGQKLLTVGVEPKKYWWLPLGISGLLSLAFFALLCFALQPDGGQIVLLVLVTLFFGAIFCASISPDRYSNETVAQALDRLTKDPNTASKARFIMLRHTEGQWRYCHHILYVTRQRMSLMEWYAQLSSKEADELNQLIAA